MREKSRGFTLTELLVVVIVLGTLAAVAAPKFARVLETRKTMEAESLLVSIRTEQEKRCTIGKGYTSVRSDVPVLAQAGDSVNYSYGLQNHGAVAQSNSKNYSLRVLSYKDGRICCEGSYCGDLSKRYPLCSELEGTLAEDECATESLLPEDPCETNPNSCGCSEYADTHACECAGVCDPCETNPNSCACSTYAAAHVCECSGVCEPCETNPNSCECSTYADAHKCECDSSYAAENEFECQCTANPNPGEECYEYKWVETSRVKGELGGYCIPAEDYCYGPQGFIACPQCKHVSGEQTHGSNFSNGNCNHGQGGGHSGSAFTPSKCNKNKLGKTTVSYCQRGYSEDDGNGRVNLYYATVTSTCQKVMKTSFSTGTGGRHSGTGGN